MNIDQRIVKQLDADSAEIDRILAEQNNGLGALLNAGLKGAMRPWFILVNVLVLINFLGLAYLVYQFLRKQQIRKYFGGYSRFSVFNFILQLKVGFITK